MLWEDLAQEAHARHLYLLGGFHPEPTDGLPDEIRTLVLLGPDDARFWPALTQSPEWEDDQPDPIDRWSRRVIDNWAQDLDAVPFYPFSGPPWHPFYSWATRTGALYASPIMLLVHAKAGLFASFRGALGLKEHIDLPAVINAPCDLCPAPCKTACPVDAFQDGGFDATACRSYLASPAGTECRDGGCLARRACPVSQRWGRLPGQSAYHMRQFAG